MEVLKAQGLKNFKYETDIKTPQSRRNLLASKLVTDLNNVACPGPLFKTTHRLKNIVNQTVNLWPSRLIFPYLIQKGVLTGSKMTVGCLGKSKMWFSIKTYKL